MGDVEHPPENENKRAHELANELVDLLGRGARLNAEDQGKLVKALLSAQSNPAPQVVDGISREAARDVRATTEFVPNRAAIVGAINDFADSKSERVADRRVYDSIMPPGNPEVAKIVADIIATSASSMPTDRLRKFVAFFMDMPGTNGFAANFSEPHMQKLRKSLAERFLKEADMTEYSANFIFSFVLGDLSIRDKLEAMRQNPAQYTAEAKKILTTILGK